MRALRAVQDGRHSATAAEASLAALEMRPAQKFLGNLTHLDQACGAGKGEAGVAERLTGCVQEKAPYGIGSRHASPLAVPRA
jgi:hypothetical protein